MTQIKPMVDRMKQWIVNVQRIFRSDATTSDQLFDLVLQNMDFSTMKVTDLNKLKLPKR